MIEKTENPLNLKPEVIEFLIAELQESIETVGHDEMAIAIKIQTTTKTFSYNLKKLKKLKAEMEDPLHQSLKEIS